MMKGEVLGSQEGMASRKWAALGIVCMGKFMGALDIAVVNLGMPVFSQQFNADPSTVGWISIAYFLVISSLLMGFGRLSDILGHRRLYLIGFTIFVTGSFFCALSQSLLQLIAFRVLQGLGAGMLMAIGTALVTDVFPRTERGKALGIIATAVSVGTAAGPTVGGLLISYWGWPSIFLINVPVGLMALAVGYFVLPKPSVSRREGGFDFTGAVLAAVALASFVFVLSRGQAWGWTSPLVLGLFLVGTASTALFVTVERRSAHPVLDMALFQHRVFTAANSAGLLQFVAVYLMLFLMPFYLMTVKGMNPAQAGLMMMPIPVIQSVLGPLWGWLSDRIGSRGLASSGMVVVAVGMITLSLLQPDTGIPWILGMLSLIGFGQSLFHSPNNSAVMGAAPRNRLGIASSVIATVRNVGMVIGVAVAGTVIATRQPVHLDVLGVQNLETVSAESLSLLYAIQDAFRLSILIAVISAVLSLMRGPKESPAEVTQMEKSYAE